METPSTNHPHKEKRINLRVNPDTNALLQQAADIIELRLEEFILRTAVAQARGLLNRPTTTRVSNDEFSRILDAIENSPAPTDNLVDALR